METHPLPLFLRLTLAAASLTPVLHAAEIHSAGSGPWSAASTWERGHVPATGDVVLIRTGHRVSYDVFSDAVIRSIHVAGTLTFSHDADTLLCTGLIRIATTEECREEGFECHMASPDFPSTGADGPALEVGSANDPIPKEHRATIRLTYVQGMDATVFPAILDCGGRMDFHGAPLEHPWVKLVNTAPRGYRDIELPEQVKDWRPGDQLLFTTTTFSDYYTEKDGRRIIPDLLETTETETAGLLAASDLGLRLKTRLQHEHRADGKYRGEIANLSRNVVVESADPAGVRGHTAYHHGSSGSISYAEFRHLGKKGVLGRYPIHFHLCGDTMRGSSVVGASIWDSDNRWLTLHGSNYILVKDCIGYRSTGHGFFFEDGTEVNNVLDHNLAVQALMGRPLPQQMLPFDTNDGAGFWWANCGNSFTGNVAADCAKFGYRYQMLPAEGFSPEMSILQSDGQRHRVDARTLPFVRFDGNESHSQRRFAFNLGGFHGQSETADLDRDGSVIDRAAYLGGDVQGVGPDYQHPFEIRNFLVWASHWGFHSAAPNVRIQGFTAHDVNYVFWRSNVQGHDYLSVDCSDIHVSTFFNGWGASSDFEAQLRYVEPKDDTPPVTLVTGWQWLGDQRVKITGVAVDGGDIASVRVNGEDATLTPGAITQWSHVLLARDGKLEIEAHATDRAGNEERNVQCLRLTPKGMARLNPQPLPAKAAVSAMAMKADPEPAPVKEAKIDAASLPYPLWDGQESTAHYAERMHLPARRTLDLNGVSLELALIPAGSFLMGEAKGDADELPVHRTVITKPYYLGVTELTQEQYFAVTGKNPSYFKGSHRPVEQVSWLDAQAFLGKAGHGLRLPTEAEWEFAARQTGPGELSANGWWGHSTTYAGGNAPDGTSEVALKAANLFGLHDMQGNVYEWCEDFYRPDAYATAAVLDPRGPDSADERVLRGGSWQSEAAKCRPANRNGYAQQSRGYLLGFRVAVSVDAP